MPKLLTFMCLFVRSGSHVELKINLQAQKIVDTETALNDSDGHLTAVKMLCNALKAENSSLKFKLADVENRSRRQNLRITEIPEELEG